MELKTWLDEELGRGVRLASGLGVPQSFVSKMASGEKPIPVARAAAIELYTNGAVTRQELRPNDWHQIWPELAQRQAA